VRSKLFGGTPVKSAASVRTPEEIAKEQAAYNARAADEARNLERKKAEQQRIATGIEKQKAAAEAEKIKAAGFGTPTAAPNGNGNPVCAECPKVAVENIRGRVCTVLGVPCNQISKERCQVEIEVEKREKAAATPTAAAQKDCTSPMSAPVEKPAITEYEEFKTLLLSTNRPGIDKLLDYLDNETDFFCAPSSSKYHDAVPGGLLHHSLRVYHNLVTLSQTFVGEYPEDTLKIIGLLHDLCKVNFYTMSIRNKKTKDASGFSIWVEEPYIDIEDQLPLGHGEKSVILAQRYIQLTNTEIMGIRWHMMAFDDLAHSYAGNLAITNAASKHLIIPLMHIADLSASFLEVRPAGCV